MSSSKIIKQSALLGQMVCSFDYGALADGIAAAELGEDEFVPLQIKECRPQAGAPVIPTAPHPEEEPSEPEGELISHNELQQQLDEAFDRGLEEGRRQAERGLGNVFKALRDGVVAITGEREKVLRESEGDLLRLCIMVARKVIQHELATDPLILGKIVSAALESLVDLDRVTIRLNPADYAAVSANRQAYLAGVGEESQLVLAPDDTIEPGGCMVDTTTGTVDARIEVQLEEIFRQFTEQRSHPVEADEGVNPEEGRHGAAD